MQRTARQRAVELRQTTARLLLWSSELADDFVRLRDSSGRAVGDRHHSFQSFVLAMNWVALAILDVERHRLAGLLAWYQSKHGRGITPDDIALLAERHRAR